MLCTFFLAVFLGLGKRKHELVSARQDATRQRKVLASYRLESLDTVLILVATATMVGYIFYTIADQTVAAFHGPRLQFTIPSVTFGILRFLQLAGHSTDPTSPTERIIKDPLFMTNMLIWTGMVVAFLSLQPGFGLPWAF